MTSGQDYITQEVSIAYTICYTSESAGSKLFPKYSYLRVYSAKYTADIKLFHRK